MNIPEAMSRGVTLSFEVFPPKSEGGMERLRGVLEGCYRTTMRPDPARQWQNYVLPLRLGVAVVLSGVVCFTARPM